MGLIHFPNPKDAGDDGLVAVGGDLRPATLLEAYRGGIFPWPIKNWPLTWFSPKERAILEFDRLHVPRSLARERRRTNFTFTIDRDFRGVIESCARVPRAHEEGTWITPAMVKAYCELHALGHAHSVEAWEGGRLVGGLYGVDAGGAFAGESMFHVRPNASKLALLHLVEHLNARGLDWLDIQMLTPHMSALGAREVARDIFLERLERTLGRELRLFD
jgi:leucyl/phenylalanyl-tRNA--protein transferase